MAESSTSGTAITALASRPTSSKTVLCLRTARNGSQTFNGGGIGGRIERFNWEGDLVWSYELATDTAHHHHDMAFLPNGNVVLMAWEYKSPEEAAAAGRDIRRPTVAPHVG